jgi:uncharacterized protein DUF2721
MDHRTLQGLTQLLQASISPVALVSGVGLLILSQTNRFSRVTDRLRELAGERRAGREDSRLEMQIVIFLRRARILRAAIGFAVGSVLMASLLILSVFGAAVLELPMSAPVLVLFTASLLCLIASLALFLWDMQLSLRAVQEELQG